MYLKVYTVRSVSTGVLKHTLAPTSDSEARHIHKYRMRAQEAAPEAAVPLLPPDRKPLPIKMPPPRRTAQRDIGVWSPFGEVFNPHGEILFRLGRKPMAREELEALEAAANKPPPEKKRSDAAARPRPSQQRTAAAAARVAAAKAAAAENDDIIRSTSDPRLRGATNPDKPLPPVFKRGLGLGMGLHPQRFPRELLKSSESRMRSCNAGYLTSAQQPSSSSTGGRLSSSSSVPSLLPTRQQRDESGASAAERGSSSPVRTLFPFDEEGFAPAEEPPKPPAEPPVGLKAKSKLAAGRSSRFLNPALMEDASEAPKLSDFERAVRPLPLGRRAGIEFKQVQRESRLKLQEALAERQRIRESVFALKHASVGLDPLVVDRHATLLNEKRRRRPGGGSSSLSAFGGGGGGGGGTMVSSTSVPELGGARRRSSGDLTPGSKGAAPAVGGAAGGAGGTSTSPASAHPLGKLGTPGLWHEHSDRISHYDGGVLRLWQSLVEHAEHPRPLPSRPGEGRERLLTAEEASALMHKVFSHLHGILGGALEERPTHVGLELVEELFRACSDDLMRVEGAREVLLPLLRVAAECANIGADETRRLHLTYAYPRDPPSNTSSPIAPGRGGRRSSAATVDDLPAPVASDGVARAVSFATPAASPEKSAAM